MWTTSGIRFQGCQIVPDEYAKADAGLPSPPLIVPTWVIPSLPPSSRVIRSSGGIGGAPRFGRSIEPSSSELEEEDERRWRWPPRGGGPSSPCHGRGICSGHACPS